jgi:hypothetical protein
MQSAQGSADTSLDRLFMTIRRTPDSDDDSDYSAFFEIPAAVLKAADAQLRKSIDGPATTESVVRMRVDMDRDDDAASLVAVLMKIRRRKEYSCRLSARGHLICRQIEGPLDGSAANTVTRYFGFVREPQWPL